MHGVRLTLAAAILLPAVYAQPASLWVLQPPNQAIEYDPQTLSVRRKVEIPRRVASHPEYLSINAQGQMLFFVPKGIEFGSQDMANPSDRVWMWDGKKAVNVPTTASQVYLSVGGDSVFWQEDTSTKDADENGVERSIRPASRMRRSGLNESSRTSVVTIAGSGTCQCTTGVCSESCPAWTSWAPDGIIGDFFLLTKVTDGQLASTYHESLLYRRSAQKWLVTNLAQPIEIPLAASADGEILLAAVADVGCCGWMNEGNDQMLLFDHGRRAVLFDERARYKNSNYDVSFSVRDARLSPDQTLAALTVASTAGASSEIRLSSDGKVNVEELARMRRTIAGLPSVEIVRISGAAGASPAIPLAELVGWLGEREIMVVQGGRLVVYDSLGNKRRETTIRVRSAADAFLR